MLLSVQVLYKINKRFFFWDSHLIDHRRDLWREFVLALFKKSFNFNSLWFGITRNDLSEHIFATLRHWSSERWNRKHSKCPKLLRIMNCSSSSKFSIKNIQHQFKNPGQIKKFSTDAEKLIKIVPGKSVWQGSSWDILQFVNPGIWQNLGNWLLQRDLVIIFSMQVVYRLYRL